MEGKSNETDTPRVANTIRSQMLTGISADGSGKSNTAGANQNQSDSTLRRKKPKWLDWDRRAVHTSAERRGWKKKWTCILT
jgi:hypothetical protein